MTGPGRGMTPTKLGFMDRLDPGLQREGVNGTHSILKAPFPVDQFRIEIQDTEVPHIGIQARHRFTVSESEAFRNSGTPQLSTLIA